MDTNSLLVRAASIDIGIHNFALQIEEFDINRLYSIKHIPKTKRYTANHEPTSQYQEILDQVFANGKTILSEKVDLSDKKYVDDQALFRLTDFLNGIELLESCSMILIEKQMNTTKIKNNIAIRLQDHAHSTLLNKYRSTKLILVYPSKNKTQILGCPLKVEDKDGRLVKVKKPYRKKWASDLGEYIYKLRGDEETFTKIFCNGIKQLESEKMFIRCKTGAKPDDECDTLVQLQSAKIKLFCDEKLNISKYITTLIIDL